MLRGSHEHLNSLSILKVSNEKSHIGILRTQPSYIRLRDTFGIKTDMTKANSFRNRDTESHDKYHLAFWPQASKWVSSHVIGNTALSIPTPPLWQARDAAEAKGLGQLKMEVVYI